MGGWVGGWILPVIDEIEGSLKDPFLLYLLLLLLLLFSFLLFFSLSLLGLGGLCFCAEEGGETWRGRVDGWVGGMVE